MFDCDFPGIQLNSIISQSIEPLHQQMEALKKVAIPQKNIQIITNSFLEPYQKLMEQYSFISSLEIQNSLKQSINQMNVLLKTLNSAFDQHWSAKFSNVVYQNLIERISSEEFMSSINPKAPSDFKKSEKVSVSSDSISDFITVEKDNIKEYKLPDSVSIPIGKNRIKIPTDFFVGLLFNILSLIATILCSLGQSVPFETELQQIQLVEKQNQLIQSQNQLLYNLLHTIDTSASSQSEALQSLKEIVEAQNLAISDLEESLDLIQKSLDNMTESDCTEPEK